MKPVSSLDELLKNMKPEQAKGKFYIATVDPDKLMAISGYVQYILCIYVEDEGLTVVFYEDIKEEMQDFVEKNIIGPFALITLTVNSDLMAVGFLAKITDALAKEKISVNAFSAYYHDHLLVPYERKEDAMKALKQLSTS